MEIPYDIIESESDTSNSLNADKKWVVFIHGFGGSRRMFKRQIEDFKKYFNLLILDLPGHGESAHGLSEVSKNNSGIKDVASGILEVLKNLNITKADFIGVSLGTLIISQIAIMKPGIVNKAVLCGAIFGFVGGSLLLLHLTNIARWFLPYRAVISSVAYVLMPKKNHKVARKFFISESKKLGRPEFMRWFELLRNNRTLIRDKMLSLLSMNTLIIMGDEDRVFIPCVTKLVKKYKLNMQTINHCGHVCNIEKYSDFNNKALNYLLST